MATARHVGHPRPAPARGVERHHSAVPELHSDLRRRTETTPRPTVAQGRRRIVPLTGGTFAGPELNGTLLPGASADWQIVLPDGTALGDVRFTLQTDHGELLYVRSQGVRHGSAKVLARLSRREAVDASE